MPRPETHRLNDTAILWERVSGAVTADAYGEPLVSDEPVQIRLKWDGSQSESLDPTGNVVVLDASAAVDRSIPIGSILKLGSLADLEAGTGFPLGGEGGDLYYVKTTTSGSNIRGRGTYHEVGLMRYKGSMPG